MTMRSLTAGFLIRQLLTACGMTQADLARATGLSVKHVNYMVANRAQVTPAVALKIETVTGFSAATLLSVQLADRLERARRARK